MSEGGKRVMEVENFDNLKGCPWPDFWQGEGNAQATAAVAAAKAGETFKFRNAANTAKGTPRYWDVQVSPIRSADGAISHLLSISRDITEEWSAGELLRQNAEKQKFLAEELTHRAKNTLATVLGIAAQTFRGEAHKERLTVFQGRVQTLSDAYNILQADWSLTAIGPVVEAALAPYRTGHGRITVAGRSSMNSARTRRSLWRWRERIGDQRDEIWCAVGAVRPRRHQLDGGFAFEFEWRETGGPEVLPPSRSGFGSRLIKSLLAHDFGGAVDLRYEPAGLVCRLRAPLA